MTNAEHSKLRANLAKWSYEDLLMVKALVENELMERDSAKPDFRDWMESFIDKMNNSPMMAGVEK